MPDRTTVISYIKITLAPILWGGSLVAGRVVSADLPPLTTTWIRFALVSLFLVPALRIIHGRLPRPTPREAGLLLALTVAGVLLFNLFLFSGLQTITAVRSSVIIAFAPSAVALILVIGFRDPAGRNTLIGIVVAFIGAIITITNGDIAAVIAGGISIGDAFLLGCVVAWAVYTILARSAMRTLTPLTVLTYSSILGALLLTPIAIHRGGIAELGAQGIGTWGGILYLSFGAAGLAYLFYYQGIRDIGANETAIFLNLEPVSAIILGVVLLREVLTGPVIAGAVLVIIGLYLVNRPERPRAA
jgi:drug/metabolite transporter (DMT)-like permease